MDTHIVPEFGFINTIAAIAIAIIYIATFSLVKEPQRQTINALIIAGAGAVYWSGGLGVWEFPFGAIMIFVAYKGLTNYTFIGIGWLLHTSWDIVHHLYANPIVSLSPSSSAGCAVCDTILAIWFFYKAPSIFELVRKTAKA
ncbi:MAG: DUF6010 family protein [Saprospiraceae bacterium]